MTLLVKSSFDCFARCEWQQYLEAFLGMEVSTDEILQGLFCGMNHLERSVFGALKIGVKNVLLA